MSDNADAHSLIRKVWMNASHWLVGRYILMPDHIHFFCSPGDQDHPLEKWMGFWKRALSMRWKPKLEEPILQRDFFDRQLRSTDSYDEKWAYVVMNPVRAGLVKNADEWPYQGELNELRW